MSKGKKGFVEKAIKDIGTTLALYSAVTSSISSNFQDRNHNIVKSKAGSITQSARQERGNTARRGTTDSSNRKRGNKNRG